MQMGFKVTPDENVPIVRIYCTPSVLVPLSERLVLGPVELGRGKSDAGFKAGWIFFGARFV